MIIWVHKDATDANCDQRARVDKVVGQRLYCTLLGSGEPAIVMPNEVCGLELSDTPESRLGIRFKVTRVERSVYGGTSGETDS